MTTTTKPQKYSKSVIICIPKVNFINPIDILSLQLIKDKGIEVKFGEREGHLLGSIGVTTREFQGVPGNVRFPSKASCEGMSAKSCLGNKETS